MGGIEGMGIKYCLIIIRNDETNVCHKPQIINCGAANRGLT